MLKIASEARREGPAVKCILKYLSLSHASVIWKDIESALKKYVTAYAGGE